MEPDERAAARLKTERLYLHNALDGGLTEALRQETYDLLGFSVKYDSYECLLTIRVLSNGDRLIGFVGGNCLVDLFIKAEREIKRGKVAFRQDKFVAPDS